MKIYVDRTHCDLCQSYCDRHVAKLIRFPEGEATRFRYEYRARR